MSERVFITHCADGDTLHALYEGAPIRVRIAGLDAWELDAESAGARARALLSWSAATSLAVGRWAILERDDVQPDRDRYDRLIRYVALEDGVSDLGQMMIGCGWGRPWRGGAYDRREEYHRAASRAVQLGLGCAGLVPVFVSGVPRDLHALVARTRRVRPGEVEDAMRRRGLAIGAGPGS